MLLPCQPLPLFLCGPKRRAHFALGSACYNPKRRLSLDVGLWPSLLALLRLASLAKCNGNGLLLRLASLHLGLNVGRDSLGGLSTFEGHH